MHLQAQIVLIYYSHSDPMGTDGQTMIGSSKKSSNFMPFVDLFHQEWLHVYQIIQTMNNLITLIEIWKYHVVTMEITETIVARAGLNRYYDYEELN